MGCFEPIMAIKIPHVSFSNRSGFVNIAPKPQAEAEVQPQPQRPQPQPQRPQPRDPGS